MIKDSILTILQSEFHRSIDDTVINRLSETLFCKNLFHEDFWKNIFSENCFITSFVNEKDIESLSHTNLIQVFVGLFHKNIDFFDIIERIIMNCLKKREAEFYHCGLWCVSKLLIMHNFHSSTLFQILNLYVCNNNVIFESLFQNVLIDIYFEYFENNMYEEFRQRFICILFEKIDEKYFTLIKILERNLTENFYDLFDIEKNLRKINVSTYILKPELLYCYAMCPNTDKVHEDNIAKKIEDLNENQGKLIAKKILYLSNGKLIKIISKNSIGASIWKICIDSLLKGDENFVKLFMSVKIKDIQFIPNNVFIKLINDGKHDFLKDLKLGNFEVYYICSFLERNNFQGIMEYKIQNLIQCLFNSFFNNHELFYILIHGSENEIIKNTYNKIIDLYKLEINNKSLDKIDFYVSLISDCLKSGLIDKPDKLKLLSTEIDSLIVFQNYLLQIYLESDNLEILFNKPLQLSKEILLLDHDHFIFHFSSSTLKELIDLSNSIVNADDFSDNIFCENLFYILLVLCVTENNEDLINSTVNFITIVAQRNIILNIKNLLEILPKYFKMTSFSNNRDKVFKCFKENLLYFQFRKCNFSIETIIDSSDDEIKDLLSQLTFIRDYCNECHENIHELIEDLALSCKPSDCYGD